MWQGVSMISSPSVTKLRGLVTEIRTHWGKYPSVEENIIAILKKVTSSGEDATDRIDNIFLMLSKKERSLIKEAVAQALLVRAEHYTQK